VPGVIVDRAIYRDGQRVAQPQDLGEMAASCKAHGGLAWIGLYRPSEAEFAEVAQEFALHELAVEDAVSAHQRPKLERYGETVFCVLRPARYVDETETVEFGEVHVFAGPQFVIEDDVFNPDADASRRIYDLTREVILFQRAAKPLVLMLARLMDDPRVDEEERRYLRDVQDHALRVQEQADGFRQLLQNILNVNLTLETKALSEVSNRQNEEVKKISAWAAILFAPSVVGTIYGMNFRHMPELHWRFGYPYALALMVAVSVTLYFVFKRRNWI
jgi:magnesium transporter